MLVMYNSETYISEQNSFNRHLVDFFNDDEKAVIYNDLNRVTYSNEIIKPKSTSSLIVFSAKEDEQVCSILFVIKEKESLLVEKKIFLRYYRNQR